MPTESPLDPTVIVTKEYRIAVVMYGGISLAIYMNGIAHELLAMVRSTTGGVGSKESTEQIYQKLALKLSEENDGKVHTSFVIDIISGTSAGGINGVFLAKALTHGASLDALKTVWVEEGDFQKLLNDQTHPDIQLDRQIPPRSLLSGERMYVKLFEAFAEMDANEREPLVENLDLWVTTTDLAGRIVPLRLSDRVVWERKYRQVFPLRYDSDSEIDDFIPDNTPFLAFASRCTSSFPVAFEPMQMAAVPDLIRASPKYGQRHDRTDEEWKKFFTENWQRFFGTPGKVGDPGGDGTDWESYFADGGYLDNHPFDHAIASLSEQSSPVHAERKLFYIEPSPEHPELERARRDKGKLRQPNAFENAWDGLAGIPGKQPIRDSLLEIQQRNRFIRKINYVISDMSVAVEEAARDSTAQPGPNYPPGGGRDRGNRSRIDPRFRAYTALNVFKVTDDLAIRIARIMGFDESSDYVYAIRCIIKAWRKQKYPDDAQFLLDFDISYRIRRLRFVKNQLEYLNMLTEGAKERLRALNALPDESETSEFRNEILELRRVLDKSFRRIRKVSLLAQRRAPSIVRPDATGAVTLAPDNNDSSTLTIQQLIERLGIVPADLDEVLGVDRPKMEDDRQNLPPGSKPSEFAPMPVLDDKEYDKRAAVLLDRLGTSRFQALRDAIVDHYRPEMAAARTAVADKLARSSDSRVRENVKRLGRLYFEQLWQFDAAIFPITYGTDVGDLMEAEVVRISPEDAIAIQNESVTHRPKLAGALFGAFGAFLERVWRRNDILWGRLDAAERIISALGSAVLSNKEIDDLTREAHDKIIEEELKPQGRDEICQMLIRTLLQAGGSSVAAQMRREDLINEVQECVKAETGSTDINPKLAAVLSDALTPDRLRKALEKLEISREPNRKRTLESLGRATRIIGRILESTGDQGKKAGGFAIRAGSIMWGLVEVATPGALWGDFFTYWSKLLLAFAVLMIVGGTIFSQAVQSLGFRLLILVFAARLAVSWLHSFIGQNNRWNRASRAAVVLALVLIFLLGLVELNHLYENYVYQNIQPAIQATRDWFHRVF